MAVGVQLVLPPPLRVAEVVLATTVEQAVSVQSWKLRVPLSAAFVAGIPLSGCGDSHHDQPPPQVDAATQPDAPPPLAALQIKALSNRADLLSGGPLGALALASLLPVAAVGLGESGLRPRSIVGGALLVGVATLAAGLLYLLILLVVGQPLSDPVVLAGGAAAGAIYNGLLAIATYPIARSMRHVTEKQASFGL